MLKGFRDFVMHGNVVDLAVAVVLGAAFGAVVNAMVENVLMPFISGLIGFPDFDSFAVVNYKGNLLQFGVLLTQLVNFLLIAAAIYFVIIFPMNKMIEARIRKFGGPVEEEDPNVAVLKQILAQLRVQTEVVNPAAFAAAVEAERQAESETLARIQELEDKNKTFLGKAKNLVWGKDN